MVLRNLFLIYNKRETYFNLLYVFIISIILIFIYSVILYPMFILGFLTLIFLVGAAILVFSIFAVRLFALFDRIILNLTLDSNIHEPDHSKKTDLLTHIKEIILSRATWYDMIYLVVVKPVLSVFMFIFSLIMIGLSVALMIIGLKEVLDHTFFIGFIAKGMGIVFLGFLLLTLSLHAINFLMEKYVRIARFFLHDEEKHQEETKRKKENMIYSSNLYKRDNIKEKPKTAMIKPKKTGATTKISAKSKASVKSKK